MIIHNRSTLEILQNNCITDNISLEIGIYKQSGDFWDYMKPDQSLDKNATYKALFKLASIGSEIGFTNVELLVKKTEKSPPIKLYKVLGQPSQPPEEVERVDFKDIPALYSSAIYRVVYFQTLEQPIPANQRTQLFSVGVYGNISPQGHHWQDAIQQSFSDPILELPVPRLDFGDVGLGLSLSRELKVNNVGNDILKVSRDTLTSGDDSAEDFRISTFPLGLEIQPGETKTFPVKFTPSKIAERKCELSLQCNDPSNLAVKISFTGKGFGLIPGPTQIDFGAVLVNAESTHKKISLKNSGAAICQLSKVEFESGADDEVEFHLLGVPAYPNDKIGPDRILNMECYAIPKKAGEYPRELVIQYNYPNGEKISIRVPTKVWGLLLRS